MPDASGHLACSPYVSAALDRIFHVGDRVALQRDMPTVNYRDERGFYCLRAPATGTVIDRPWIWRREVSPSGTWSQVCVAWAGGPTIMVPPEFLKRVE
jgi:hypothetical protein